MKRLVLGFAVAAWALAATASAWASGGYVTGELSSPPAARWRVSSPPMPVYAPAPACDPCAQPTVTYMPVAPAPVATYQPAVVAPAPVVVARPIIAPRVVGVWSPVVAPAVPVAVYSPVTTSVPVTAYSPVAAPVAAYAPAAAPTVAPVVGYAPAAPVYTVGRPVVVSTKVYVPGQPLRNTFRAVTP